MRGFFFSSALLALLLTHGFCAESGPGSFAYVLQADALAGTKEAVVRRLAACGRDWVVLDAVFAGDVPWKPADLEGIRRGQPGRKVLAYLSIGEAEDYRPYWREEWGRGGNLSASAPHWLGAENPQWPGNYRVHYWDAGWQKLMLAALDEAMASGFDGIYLDLVDAFQSFELDGEDFIDDRKNADTGQSYRRDMVDWVKTLAARARSRRPGALVISQNGSQLLRSEDFRAAINAIGVEDLFTAGNHPQSKAHTEEVLGHLQLLGPTGAPALLIEYPQAAERQALVKRLAAEHGLVWLLTDRPLKTLGTSGR